jgi:large subunit ribosomal protein L18
MDHTLKRRKRARWARVHRVRKSIRGTFGKPRFSVSKTNLHLYAQLIDDERGVTIGGVGTRSKGTAFPRKSKEAARHIGTEIARIAKENQIATVVFDRGRYQFHGIIAELANAAREAGLQF